MSSRRGQRDGGGGGQSGRSAAAKSMNLKGATMTNAVGKCVSVLYDEGGAELVAYRGVVVYVERARYALADCTAPSRPSPPPRPTAMPLPHP